MSNKQLAIVTVEFFRYFCVSIFALAIDLGLLLVLANWMHYVLAASASFIVGACAHYVLSVRFVFVRRRLAFRQGIELLVFVGLGVGALLVNVAAITIAVEFFAASLPVAKLFAAGFSFAFGYGARKVALFR